MMRAQVPDPGPLTILGPPGVERFLSQLREVLGFFINYPIHFVEWHEGSPEVAYEDEQVRILWGPLKHTIPCLGYRFEEHPRYGEFKPEAARALGIPPGPLWGTLQRGEKVTLESGTVISPRQVVGPPRPGRRVCYAVDTRPAKSLYRLCQDVDMAFLDGMLSPELREEAEEKGHMTVDEAGRIAAASGVHRAVLVHVSPRYKEEDLEKLAVAASQRFERIEMGRDLQWYSVPLRED